MALRGHSHMDGFGRQTSSGRVIPEIDGLRFIAIMWVLLFHVYGSIPGRSATDAQSMAQAYLLQALSVGSFGVKIFFFLSSFMLAIPFAKSHLLKKKKVVLSRYYIRRVTRMYPPYVIHLVVLTGSFVALGWTGLIWDSSLAARPDFIAFVLRHNAASALCVHNVAAGYANPLNCPLWTIEVTAQFYLVLPLLAAIYRVRHTWLRRLMLTCIVGSTCWFTPSHRLVALATIIPHLPYFALGLLFADLYVLTPQIFRRSNILWDIVGLIAFVAITAMLTTGIHRTVVPWILGIFCVAVFKGPTLSRLCALPAVLAIGAMSYTVYLYHYLFAMGVGRALQHAFGKDTSIETLGIHCMVIAGTTLLSCSLLFRLFERPFMDKDWPSRLLARFRMVRDVSLASNE